MYPLYSLEVHKNCESTMDLAKDWVLSAPQSSIHFIHSYSQSKGRGKRERVWISAKGNFFGTLVLPFPYALEKRGDMAFLIAVAAAKALNQFDPVLEIKFKWPNDLMIQRKKLGGILLESLTNEGGDHFLSIGVGINFMDRPDHIPSTALSLHMKVMPTLDDFRDLFIDKIFYYYGLWQENGFAPIRHLWLNQALNIGETIQLFVGKEMINGTFKTLDEQGALVLVDDRGREKVFHTGEVLFEHMN
ncbi:MAG: biotin--[acetyl-CoA-carboxylase] ligase [Alphaproteobacteria bacterium]